MPPADDHPFPPTSTEWAPTRHREGPRVPLRELAREVSKHDRQAKRQEQAAKTLARQHGLTLDQARAFLAQAAATRAQQRRPSGPTFGCCGHLHPIPTLPYRLPCCGRVLGLPPTSRG